MNNLYSVFFLKWNELVFKKLYIKLHINGILRSRHFVYNSQVKEVHMSTNKKEKEDICYVDEVSSYKFSLILELDKHVYLKVT